MKKAKFKILTIALVALFVLTPLCFAAFSANANSAQMSWSGSYATGAMVMDENCPVEVEKEVLTFDIGEFPSHFYDEDVQEFLDYGASVTANYTFYNPADYTVNVNLAFPLGELPSYAYFYYEQPDDTAKYKITADGQEVERSLRHTFYRGYGYDNSTDLPKLKDGYQQDDFFSPDMPVVKYTVDFTDMVYGKNENEAFAVLDMVLPDGARATGNMGIYASYRDFAFSDWVKNGCVNEIYVIGSREQPSFECTFYTDASQRRKTSGTMQVTQSEQTDFQSLVLSYRGNRSVISDIDYYNAVLDCIHYNMDGNYSCFSESYLRAQYTLMRWYVYSLTIQPKGRVVNEVSAPVYPDINGRYSPAKYGYEYLLSPAQSWASFGEFEVKINTPYYVTDSSVQGFEKTDYGYSYSSETLPAGELVFSLCMSESPERVNRGVGISIIGLVIFIIVLGRVIAIIVCAIVLVALYCKKKK